MRKIYIPVLLCILLALTPHTLHAKEEVLRDDGSYHIVNVLQDGRYEVLDSMDSYAKAKVVYTLKKQAYRNLGITYGKDFLTIEQGVVELPQANDCSVNTTYINDANQEQGYTNGCYGGDAAFLEYNPATKKVKFALSGVIGWVDGKDVSIHPLETLPNVSNFTVSDKQELYHHIKRSLSTPAYDNTISLGMAPTYLKPNTTYYSYDTHYFYDDFAKLSQDLRSSSHAQAVNAKQPYYNYYQYVNHRSTSAYTKEDVDKYFKDTLALRQSITAFYDRDNYIHDILTQSLLLQGESGFFQYQNEYGVNALMMLSLAMNESAIGRSYLAFTRNNLFGHAAYDSAVQEHATRYTQTNDSIYSHALHYLSDAYLNPKQFQYHGGYFGNKAGGMNVSYASDPYWGEKAAQYYQSLDAAMGKKDHQRYALGISKNTGVSIYQKAAKKSKVLYSMPKGYEGSFILLERITNKDGDWYRVQSEPALTSEQQLSKDAAYNFSNSYGFMSADAFQSIQNRNMIKEKSYVNLTFEANGGSFYPDLATITLQVESGKLPVVIAPTKEHALFDGWDIPLEKARQNLTYKAKWKKVDSIELVQKPLTHYQVQESLDVKKGSLRVNFADGSTKEVPMSTDMISDFSTAKKGSHLVTITYAGCTLKYEIKVDDSLQKKEDNLRKQAAAIIKTYSGQTDLNEEAQAELKQFREDISKLDTMPLSFDALRVVDRIFQENLSPRYSVIIKDKHHDLQISGLSMALSNKESLLTKVMPETIVIKVKDGMDEDKEALGRKVAKANGMKVEGMVTMDGTDNFSSLKYQQEVVYSLRKPKKDKNLLYRIYAIDDGNVTQLLTRQSANRILFSAKQSGSYMIVSQNVGSLKQDKDFQEVNTIALNGKNYIQRYIIFPLVIILLLAAILLSLVVYKKRHPNLRFRRPHFHRKKE